MSHTYTNLNFHLVFSTKNREPLITDEVRPRLYDYMGGIIRQRRGMVIELNGVTDHVHLLARLHPNDAVAVVLRELKSNATGWMHKVFPAMRNFSWQNGYGAFTVSHSQIPSVQDYIRHQEDHHQKRSFRDEFILLLKKNGIEFDERYLWI